MNFDYLARHIFVIDDTLQQQVVHAVNQGLTVRNWLIGCYIVEFEQHGEDRAAYGEKLLKHLEERLNRKGLTGRRFREFRRIYQVYPQLAQPIMEYLDIHAATIRQTMSAELELRSFSITAIESTKAPETSEIQIRHTACAELQTLGNGGTLSPLEPSKLFNRLPYSHIKRLSKIEDPLKRAFYEVETIAGCWTDRELERQINSLYYERSGFSSSKADLSVLVNRDAESIKPTDIIEDPVALEFLGLPTSASITETDLESAILDNMETFLYAPILPDISRC